MSDVWTNYEWNDDGRRRSYGSYWAFYLYAYKIVESGLTPKMRFSAAEGGGVRRSECCACAAEGGFAAKSRIPQRRHTASLAMVYR